MDSAMDTASTASDHSIASSNDSRGRNVSSPLSHTHNGSVGSHHLHHAAQHHAAQHQQQHHQQQQQHHQDKTRTPTPVSPVHNSHGSNGSNGGGAGHNNNGSNSGGSNATLNNHTGPGRQLSSSPLSAGAAQAQMLGHLGGHPQLGSPPHVSTPSSMGMVGMAPRMAQNLSHIPPHGLGLLNSFMHHASPLDLMAAAHHHVPPRSYNSPPPISSSDPTANECKLVDYRGQKVAAFMIQGETMLCLPQAFELFLKHLVGGLHTVYTKLKRLDIVPLVCNVEQVRILRGLGAIQPGVNRCKLLSCKDFDVLYRDCTTARCLSIKPPESLNSSNSLLSNSSRPGRPPKRGPVGLSMPATHMQHHAAQLKKHRLDNGEFVYENGHLGDLPRLDKSPLLANGYNAPPTHLNHIPFMQMNPHGPGGGHHPLMSPGVNPHGIPRPDGSIIKGQNIPGMEAIARAAYEDIVKHLERLREERGEDRTPGVDHKPRDLSSQGSGPPLADSPNGQSPALNLSKSSGADHTGVGGGASSVGVGGGVGGGGGSGAMSERSTPNSPEPSVHEEDDNLSEANISDTEEPNEKDEDISDCERDISSPVPVSVPCPVVGPQDLEAARAQALNYSSLAVAVGAGVPPGQDPSISSTETLLRNIQGLLKVAADNARQQERQTSYEKAELKMDVIREREVKDSFERQLADEKRVRALYQKRFKKERRLRMQIQERLDGERKRRVQLEDIIKASGAPAEALRIIAENISSEQQQREKERERDAEREKDHREKERDRDGGRQGRDKGQEREREPVTDRNRDHHRGGAGGGAGGVGGGGSGGGGGGGLVGVADPDVLRDRHRSAVVEIERERRASSSERYSKEGSPVAGNLGTARPSQEVSPSHHHTQPQISEGKSWSYPGLDIMATGAFWQNYSESLAQELELERKARQQAAEGDVKGPLQDRSNYYKNSVLYTSAT
ncbi:dachshund homolog 2-like isoform X2 [Anopheles albimanus]|uniref:dachshund homolog 2-like isoform X2 n=1 Tax=Anopheles albimanus TaxID=7167 RepID=UPI001640AC82|nr:dachshund homolog 2-like isoform X2 [Anopheles albimanus]